MKDRLQERVTEETRGAGAAAVVAYFREASRRFRREVSHACPESVASPTAVRETDPSPYTD